MPQDSSDYEKKIAQANAARQRQIERQKQKLACPDYQKQQQAKQQESRLKTQQRSYDRMKQRLADPAFILEQQQKQRENQIKSAEKQHARQLVKESTPDYIKQNLTKRGNTKQTNPIRSKGTKGRNPTAIEKHLGNKIGEIGCICCLNKNWYTSDMQEQETTKFISLHHVDGRTKKWAHAKVLPLCAYHHDTPAPGHAPEELTPIHRGNKKEWIKLNGSEEELLKQVYEIIDEDRPWLD